MPKDKYAATWVSHTSISDFQKCPRSYFLKNIYKDPHTGHKIQLISPALSLGAAVHEVLESLSVLPTASRFDESLVLKFDQAWSKYSGKKGGFLSLDLEHRFKERGKAMLRKIMDSPGPLKNKAVKINQELPFYWLSPDEDIILCGKIDWLEYNESDDSVNILDFKTGKKDEADDSLQLPIYLLLAKNCQKRKVAKAYYWYLENFSLPTEKPLPDATKAESELLTIARQIKLARKLDKLACPNGREECLFCQSYERLLKGEGEFVCENDYHQDMYLLSQKEAVEEAEDSYII